VGAEEKAMPNQTTRRDKSLITLRRKDVVTKAQLAEELDSLRRSIWEIHRLLNPAALRDLTIAARTLTQLGVNMASIAEGLRSPARREPPPTPESERRRVVANAKARKLRR
jgi:hypothetical protein